jgi:GAF domain
MRWFVEISPMGAKGGQDLTLCVEAPQWQPALQKARALRGDNGALSNFSIELLDDGYRAIDPMARLRYIVKRAPDNAPLTNGSGQDAPLSQPPKSAAEPAKVEPVKAAPEPVKVAPEPAKPIVPAPEPEIKKRAPAPTVGFASSGAAHVQPAEPAEAPEPAVVAPAPEVKKRASVPTIGFTSSGSALLSEEPAEAPSREPARAAPAPTPAPTSAPSEPSFVVIGSREDNPTESSPLTYREYVYAVAQGTPEDEAKSLILGRFAYVRSTLDPTRSGKLINLAVFDHVFQGRPQRRPLVTLTWKDWKGDEPEIRFPQREGQGETPTPLAPRPSSPPQSMPRPALAPAAPAAVAKLEAKPETKPEVKPETKPQAPVAAVPAPTPVKAEPPPPSVKPSKPAPVAVAAVPSAPAPARQSAPPPPAPIARAAAARVAAPAAPKPAVAKPAAAPASSARPAAPKKRLGGDDLLAELFEAFGDLHFARDSLEGAEFVLDLTLEKLPSEVGLVSLFDMNKREFVVVRQAGGPRSALCARQPEKAALAGTAMRKRHAIVVADAEGAARAMDDRWRAIGVELKSLVCAPIELSGRYLGLIELANPVDGHAFNEGDGNALTYIGQQFAEFVASRGVIVDAEQIREAAKPDAPPPPKSSAGSPKSSKKGR